MARSALTRRARRRWLRERLRRPRRCPARTARRARRHGLHRNGIARDDADPCPTGYHRLVPAPRRGDSCDDRDGARPHHPRLLARLRRREQRRETPLLFTITGMWSALQGSILLWGLILAGYLAFDGWRYRAGPVTPSSAWAMLVGLGDRRVLLRAHGRTGRSRSRRPSGRSRRRGGPERALAGQRARRGPPGVPVPRLRRLHGPVLLCHRDADHRRVGEGWLVETRRFAVFSFAFLTLGIMLGSWWSYQVLGWGGFWGWDPVENAASCRGSPPPPTCTR
jgi:hypothetical protein